MCTSNFNENKIHKFILFNENKIHNILVCIDLLATYIRILLHIPSNLYLEQHSVDSPCHSAACYSAKEQ